MEFRFDVKKSWLKLVETKSEPKRRKKGILLRYNKKTHKILIQKKVERREQWESQVLYLVQNE